MRTKKGGGESLAVAREVCKRSEHFLHSLVYRVFTYIIYD